MGVFAQTLVLPQRYELSATEKKGVDKVEFYTFPYSSEQIDLRGLKKQLPEFDLPDQVSIKAPYLGAYQDITVLFGALEEGKKDEKTLIIMLAANYESERVTFFVDDNQDRNFNNDFAPLVLEAGGDAQKVLLTPFGENTVPIKFWLQIPPRNLEGDLKEKLKGKFFKTKIKHQFAVGAHVGFSTGGLDYQYDNTEIGFPTWYSVNMTEKNIGLALSYNLPRWRIEFTGTYQNLFHYTSYLNIRTDNPETKVTSQGTIIIDNVQIESNQDRHTNHRLQSALLLAYRGQVGETTEIQPLIKVGYISYLPGIYGADRHDSAFDYELPASPFIELGIQTEFTTGMYKAFFLEITVNKTWWNPEDMFAALPVENLEINYTTWRGSIGYRIGLF